MQHRKNTVLMRLFHSVDTSLFSDSGLYLYARWVSICHFGLYHANNT